VKQQPGQIILFLTPIQLLTIDVFQEIYRARLDRNPLSTDPNKRERKEGWGKMGKV